MLLTQPLSRLPSRPPATEDAELALLPPVPPEGRTPPCAEATSERNENAEVTGDKCCR